MVENKQDLLKILTHINPSMLEYQEWINVGMALKDAGYMAVDWDNWSRRDTSRYHPGECFDKWGTFQGSPTPVKVGTIVQYAKDHGWEPEHTESRELDWNDTIGGRDDYVIIDKGWIEGREVIEPETWEPVSHLTKYLEVIFEASDNVGYVTESWYDAEKNKHMPTKGNWDRTAGELIQALNECKGDIGAVLGDYNPDVGAWIRFNPMDGKGAKNENVAEFRHALVESDAMDIDQQNAIIRELELPVTCLVHSGKKSLHAIVKIDAANYDEYRKRVDYLYTVLKKNGMSVDTQNKNPSRLSRMPGVMRSGHKQFLIDTNIGKESWKEWQEWIEGVNDDLPDPENLADVWDNMPPLAPTLIDGVLRQGHKMLLAGPSKAGKSFALLELCAAVAEGNKWLKWQCTQGNIMYINLELDRPSCLHRFKDIYTSLGWPPNNIHRIDIWGLRGMSIPMDKLAPKLIRRAAKKNFIAIVIDPIYKVITGDENSADQMAHFCNQFDKVCKELNTAVIYCHHHSKGSQGNKRSMDRASGSGVFARDPDALLDMIELDLPEKLTKQEENKAVCRACEKWLQTYIKGWEDEVSQDDRCSERAMLDACQRLLSSEGNAALQRELSIVRQTVKLKTAWRVEGALREFPKFPPLNIWYDYPLHQIDTVGSLKDVDADGEAPSWQKNFKKKKASDDVKSNKKNALETAFELCIINDKVTVKDMAEYIGVTEKTIRTRLKEHGGFWIEEGEVGKKSGKISEK